MAKSQHIISIDTVASLKAISNGIDSTNITFKVEGE